MLSDSQRLNRERFRRRPTRLPFPTEGTAAISPDGRSITVAFDDDDTQPRRRAERHFSLDRRTGRIVELPADRGDLGRLVP
jgi:hypothetical protein